MFEHLNKIPFWHHCFIISLRKERLLLLEPGSLIERIIEFRESISDFTPCYNRLESFHSSWICSGCLGERGDNLRMIDEKYWTSNLFTNILPESISESFPIISFIFDSEFLEFISHCFISCSEKIDTSFGFHGIEVVQFWPVSCKIKCMSFGGKYCFSIDFLSDSLIEFLYELHPIFIVCICPIELHIGEFLEMFWTGSFVAIGSSDLKSFWKSSCHEPLLPEFSNTDSHIYIDIIVVVMSGEWTSFRSSGSVFDSRSFYFKESFCFEKIPSDFPELGFAIKHRSEIFIHRHIEVSLSESFLIILNSMPFFWKGTDCLGEKSEFLHKKSEFSLVSIEELSTNPDKVAKINEFFCKFVGR